MSQVEDRSTVGGSVLATVDQQAAEQLALQVLASPEVAAARVAARRLLEAHPHARHAAGARRLDVALDAWTVELALQEVDCDPADPKVVWSTTVAPHSWFGHEFPGGAAAIDNPDNVYRHVAIDGASAYELSGTIPEDPPAQFVFQLTQHPKGLGFASNRSASVGDRMASHATLTSDALEVEPDGSFVVTLDASPVAGRPNHLTLPDGDLYVTVRDTFSDWAQRPVSLEVRRTGGPAPSTAPSTAEIAARTAAHLPGFVEFWLDFIDDFQGRPPANELVRPYGRTGGWGFAAACRFELDDDHAIVLRLVDGGAPYLGLQVTDPWMVTPSPIEHLSSYNAAQTVPNEDGSATYVVAPSDPGVANWLDTAGLDRGYLYARWQGTLPGTDGDRLVPDFAVVAVEDLAGVLAPAHPKVTSEERAGAVSRRAADWRRRVGHDAAREPEQ